MINVVMKGMIAAIASIALLSACSDDSGTESTGKARVYIIEPNDGATVKSPVKVTFGIEGMTIAPAGSDTPNSGHHHLLIDTSLEDYASAIPADENHVHFGKGQTETSVELTPGKHTLQLILGDKNHVPHNPAVESDVISITVAE